MRNKIIILITFFCILLFLLYFINHLCFEDEKYLQKQSQKNTKIQKNTTKSSNNISIKRDNAKAPLSLSLSNDRPTDKSIKPELEKKFINQNKLKEIAEALSINMLDLMNFQKKFKSDHRHLGWMSIVESFIEDKNDKKKIDDISMHNRIFLSLSEQLDKQYLQNNLQYFDYKSNLIKSFKWHQSVYSDSLSENEYKKIFKINIGEADEIIESVLSAIPEYEILNPKSTHKDLIENVPGYKLEQLKDLFKQRELQKLKIISQYENDKITSQIASKQIKQNFEEYLKKSRKIFTNEEYLLIFGDKSN